MNDKKDIRSLTLEEIIQFCEMQNLPKFRAKQIWEWLWKKKIAKKIWRPIFLKKWHFGVATNFRASLAGRS